LNPPTIIDIRDLTWEYQVSQSLLVKVCQKILRFLVLNSIKKAFLVTASTNSETDYIKSRCKNTPVITIKNGIERTILDELQSEAGKHSIYIQKDSATVFYAGALGYAQGIEVLANCAVCCPEYNFIIVGDGPEYENISVLIKRYNINNIKVLGKIPRNEVLEYYKNISILFFRLREGFSTAVPSKVYEYLATGKPIIYMGHPDDEVWKLLTRDGLNNSV
jgi:glycosyltransferase involved in cell wall biosynthesis